MGKRTVEQLQAEAEAHYEASQHLLLSWTDSPAEILAGKYLSDKLNKEAERLFQLASDRTTETVSGSTNG